MRNLLNQIGSCMCMMPMPMCCNNALYWDETGEIM